MGVVLPASEYVTTVDCTVTFGSSNDTAMLRMRQLDGAGTGMFKYAVGGPDAGFGSGGTTHVDVFAGGAGNADSDPKIIAAPGGKMVIQVNDTNANTDGHLARITASGALDGTFGTGGRLTWTIPGATQLWGADIALQSDGKILASGMASIGGNSYGLVTRVLDTGVLDTSFGGGDGMVTLCSSGTSCTAVDVVEASDGSIFVAGYNMGSTTGYVAKLKADGSLDTTWDSDGYADVVDGANSTNVYALDIASDGRVAVTGVRINAPTAMLVSRFLTTGAPDTSVDGDGTLTYIPPGELNAGLYDMEIEDNDRIVAAGYQYNSGTSTMRVAVLRMTAAGALDTSFGGDGVAAGASGASPWEDEGGDVIVQADGSPVVAGTGMDGGTGDDDFYVTRFQPNGAVDTTFGTAGNWLSGLSANMWEYGSGITLHTDGSIVAAADYQAAGVRDTLLVRFAGTTVADYGGGNLWSGTNSFFGTCLSSVGANTTADWTPSAGCPATDGAHWQAMPTTGSKVAHSSASLVTAASVNVRFGMQTASSHPPGSYYAPVSFEVVAPNV